MELQWPLILFTTLTAWGCGVFGGAGVLALKGAGKKSQQLLAILSCVLPAAGGIAVFFHLQHWERIFNGFGHHLRHYAGAHRDRGVRGDCRGVLRHGPQVR